MLGTGARGGVCQFAPSWAVGNAGELVARARVPTTLTEHRRQARRAPSADPRVYRWRRLTVDVLRHRVLGGGVEIELRPIELSLLVALLQEPTRTFSRADIVATVWGAEVPTSPRTVDVHVRRLRGRLGQGFSDLIETIHGSGYRLRREV